MERSAAVRRMLWSRSCFCSRSARLSACPAFERALQRGAVCRGSQVAQAEELKKQKVRTPRLSACPAFERALRRGAVRRGLQAATKLAEDLEKEQQREELRKQHVRPTLLS